MLAGAWHDRINQSVSNSLLAGELLGQTALRQVVEGELMVQGSVP